VGIQAYYQLGEVYRALRLVVNCFQPSLKLQAKVPTGEQVRRVYDAAQTPLQRLLASGVLSETRQRELSKRVAQIDPLALSGYLDVLRRALLCGTHTATADPHLLEEVVSAADQPSSQAQPIYAPPAGTSSCTTGEHEADHLALITLEQAIVAYMQEMRISGRDPKTLQWHQTSLGALRRYVWRQFHLADIGSLTRASLQTWLTDLSIAPSARTGAMRTVSTVAAYARSARAFCNWLVRQGYVSERFFPQDAVPKAQRSLPQSVEPEAFVRLLRACQLTGSQGGKRAGMTARNRVILWLLRDTGLQVSDLCRLRLGDVDRTGGTVTVRGKRGDLRIFPLSVDGQRAVNTYLDQARLTPVWEPAVPEARDRLLLTEQRQPLTKVHREGQRCYQFQGAGQDCPACYQEEESECSDTRPHQGHSARQDTKDTLEEEHSPVVLFTAAQSDHNSRDATNDGKYAEQKYQDSQRDARPDQREYAEQNGG
jgi:site-specific recombinase XerD